MSPDIARRAVRQFLAPHSVWCRAAERTPPVNLCPCRQRLLGWPAELVVGDQAAVYSEMLQDTFPGWVDEFCVAERPTAHTKSCLQAPPNLGRSQEVNRLAVWLLVPQRSQHALTWCNEVAVLLWYRHKNILLWSDYLPRFICSTRLRYTSGTLSPGLENQTGASTPE